MGAISFFDEDRDGLVNGSSFGEPDGTEHLLEVLEGNGRLIIRVKLNDQKTVDLLPTDEQAVSFYHAVHGVLRRIGLDKQL